MEKPPCNRLQAARNATGLHILRTVHEILNPAMWSPPSTQNNSINRSFSISIRTSSLDSHVSGQQATVSERFIQTSGLTNAILASLFPALFMITASPILSMSNTSTLDSWWDDRLGLECCFDRRRSRSRLLDAGRVVCHQIEGI